MWYHQEFHVFDPGSTQVICHTSVVALCNALDTNPTEEDLQTLHQVLPGMFTFPDFAIWMWGFVSQGSTRPECWKEHTDHGCQPQTGAC